MREIVADLVVVDGDPAFVKKVKSLHINGCLIPGVTYVDISQEGDYNRTIYTITSYDPWGISGGVLTCRVDRLNYQILTEEEEKEMTKEAVKITVKRSEPNPPPVLSVTLELTPEQASVLRYYFGRLSPAKVRTNLDGALQVPPPYESETVHRLTSSIYDLLLEEGL